MLFLPNLSSAVFKIFYDLIFFKKPQFYNSKVHSPSHIIITFDRVVTVLEKSGKVKKG